MQTELKHTELIDVKDSRQLTRKTISGLWWSLSSQVLRQASQFLIVVFLARLLAPQEFGLVAMVVVFSGFAALFSDLGFGPALVQRQEIEERHLCSVFWVNVFFGVALAGLLAAASPLIARFYHEPRLMPITISVGLCFPIASLGIIQKVILTRHMDFRALGLIDFGTVIISGMAAIVLAWRGFGVWSLVCQMLCLALVEVAGLWWLSNWRPRALFDRSAIRDLLGFSSNLTGFTAINYWYRNGDNLLVGKFFGGAALGIYSRAYNLMLMPLTQITYVVSKVMFPTLARLQQDKEQVKDVYLRAIAMIALVTFPLMLGLLVVADHFILAIYGTAWAGVIPILRVFCILGMVQSVYSTIGWIYQSQGRTDWMFRWGLFSAVLSIAGMVLGICLGSPLAIAICLTVIGILLLSPGFAISGKLIGLTPSDVAKSTLGVTGCAAGMSICVWILGTILPRGWPDWAYLVTETLFGAGIYTCLVHLFRLASYRGLRVLLSQQLEAAFGPSALSAGISSRRVTRDMG
jgi:O-antigen/teichoic acid export membrane protein